LNIERNENNIIKTTNIDFSSTKKELIKVVPIKDNLYFEDQKNIKTNNDTVEVTMLFETLSMIKLNDIIKSTAKPYIKISSPGGTASTKYLVDSIIKSLRANNKKIVISNYCYSMCANFISMLPKELLIHEKMSEIHFHNGELMFKEYGLSTKILINFMQLVENSFIYQDYISNNSTLSYIEFLSMMDKTSQNIWLQCKNKECGLVKLI
jgi:hypothetical protein